MEVQLTISLWHRVYVNIYRIISEEVDGEMHFVGNSQQAELKGMASRWSCEGNEKGEADTLAEVL